MAQFDSSRMIDVVASTTGPAAGSRSAPHRLAEAAAAVAAEPVVPALSPIVLEAPSA